MQTSTSAALEVTSDFPVTPLLLPSATGFANSGNGKLTSAASAGLVTSSKAGVGTPQPRATCFAMPLCNVRAQTSGSENVYGIPYASSNAGTCDSRPKPATPSATLKTRSQRQPATSRAASARTWPMRSTSWPSSVNAPAIASIVFKESNSATSCSANPSAK